MKREKYRLLGEQEVGKYRRWERIKGNGMIQVMR